MKPEQDEQALSISKRGKQSEQLPSVDTDDFEELKKRGLNLAWVWRTIKRNVLLITGVTTVVATATLFSALTSPRSYEGSFQLLVEPITSEAKFTDPTVLSRDEEAYTTVGVNYPSLLQILQSPGLLSVIAKQIQAKYPDVTYESLSKDLVVQRIGQDVTDFSNIIEVHYQGEDPKKVQFILAEVGKGYLKYSLENRKSHISEGVKFIEDQLPGLQQRVNNLQLHLQALQQQYKLTDPENEGKDLSKQILGIKTQKLETQRNLQEQRTLYMKLQEQLGLTPNEALAASTLSQEPRYQELLEQLQKIESQIAVDSARFSEESPSMQALRQQQKNLLLLLNQEAQKILGQNQASTAVLNFQDPTRLELIKQLVDTANQVQVLEVRNQELAKDEAFLEQQVRQFPATMRQYNDLQRQLEIAINTLNQLLIQRETLRVEAAQKEVPWQLVSEPRIPRDAAGNLIPASSSTAKKLAMGVIGGLVLGFVAAVIKDKYRNIFYTTEDIQDATELPILGVIPFDKSAKKFTKFLSVVGSIQENEVAHYYYNASPFLEAFNSLYTSIRFLASNSPVRSLVVCSAASGDGKTTTALHLAETAAAMGQRVLLVDANLCLPQLHTKLGLSNLEGLSNLLSQNLNPNDVIQRSLLEDNLFVLTSGQIVPGSTKLLASSQMQYLMAQFQAAFDLVIYDTPALLGLADANFLAAHADGLLMVVGVGKTSRSAVMQVLHKLNTWRLPILGIVANHIEESKNSSYGYHKRYYKQNHRVRPTTNILTSENKSDVALQE